MKYSITLRRYLSVVLLGVLGQPPAWSAPPSAGRIVADAARFAADKPAALQPIFKTLYLEGEHNAVLNFDYLGLAALEQGEYATAEKAFDAAILRIEAIYANNPSAQKAKSLFAAEKVKDFKGEPYERAMTFYYRGVLYLRAGDYQNARASFLAAEWQSSLNEIEAYDSTFGLMDFLAAWASHCDGDDARADDLRARAVKVQPDVFARLSPDTTYVGLIESGVGPSKVGVGQYREKLTFQPSADVAPIDAVQAPSATLLPPVLAGDLNWQATTRSGRPIDAILNGKAQWKSATESASTALTVVGYTAALQGAVSGNQNLTQAGTLGMVAGLAGSLFARAMTPSADTRAWTSLPAGITVVGGTVTADSVPKLEFKFGGSATAGAAELNTRTGKCAFSWGRTQSGATTANARFTGAAPEEARHEALNVEFRAMLDATFPGTQSSTTANLTNPAN